MGHKNLEEQMPGGQPIANLAEQGWRFLLGVSLAKDLAPMSNKTTLRCPSAAPYNSMD